MNWVFPCTTVARIEYLYPLMLPSSEMDSISDNFLLHSVELGSSPDHR